MIITLDISPEFINDHIEKINFDSIVVHTPDVPIEFIMLFSQKLNWDLISRCIDLSSELIDKFSDFLNFEILSTRCDIPIPLIDKYKYMPWNWNILTQKYLKLAFISKFKDASIDWEYISENYEMTEKFVYEFRYYLKWDKISYLLLSPQFLIRYYTFVDWDVVSLTYCFDSCEKTLVLLSNYVNWEIVAKYHYISDRILYVCEHLLDWVAVSRYQKLSFETIVAFKNKLDPMSLIDNENLQEYKETIARLYKFITTCGFEQIETLEVCAICREVNEIKCITPCKHIFHDKCLTMWINASKTKNCPMCRTKIL